MWADVGREVLNSPAILLVPLFSLHRNINAMQSRSSVMVYPRETSSNKKAGAAISLKMCPLFRFLSL